MLSNKVGGNVEPLESCDSAEEKGEKKEEKENQGNEAVGDELDSEHFFGSSGFNSFLRVVDPPDPPRACQAFSRKVVG